MRAVAALLPAAFAIGAFAQDYPNHSLRLVVPFAPGGGADIVARAIAAPLARRLGQPVVVDNKPGGGATLGADIVAKAPADGYTLLYTTPGPQMANPYLMAKLPYDPARDSGALRALGVATARRSPLLPDVPAIAEELPGFEAAPVNYISAPARTPQAVIDRLNREINAVLQSPELKEQLAAGGVIPQGSTAPAMADLIRSEAAKWKKVIEVSGARLE